MSLVVDAFKNLLPPRLKKTPKGWYTFNAPCCHHRGHRQDTKGRCGVRFDHGVSFHCFNCHYTTSWKPGRQLSRKFKSLCRWMGADEAEINKMVFEALKSEAKHYEHGESNEIITFEEKPLPGGSVSIAELVEDETFPPDPQLIEAIQYIYDRGFDPCDDFYWSDEMPSRFVVPFRYGGKIVGSTARKVGKGQPKYLNDKPADFVFNLDKQSYEQRYILVCEGPLDAKCIRGVGLLTNAISSKQARLINAFGAEVIVVPDQDSAGLELVDQAIEQGWSVAFPTWDDDVNDCAQAVQRYGQLFVLVDIIKTTVSGKIKLKVARNQFEKKIKRIEENESY